jgi:tight adherence protein B
MDMDYLYYSFGLLIFVAVLLALEALHLKWKASSGPQAQAFARRLRMISTDRGAAQALSIVKQRLLSKTPALHALLQQLPQAEALDRLLLQSGLSWNVGKLLGIAALAAAAGTSVASYLALPWLLWLALAGLAPTLPFFLVLRAKARRLACIEQQLPDALDMMGRAMRAGHAFPTALKMAGDEMNDPLAGELRTTFDEVNFGIAMPDALMNLARRVPSTDLRYVVIAVLIQRETGGNLSELLGNISAIVRDRIKLLGQVKVLSAEGKMSGWVLSVLPFGAALMIQLTNPTFLEVLYTDPGGRKMLAAAGVMMLIGVLAMRKIVHIRV